MHERISINGYTYDKQVHETVPAAPDLVHEVLTLRDAGVAVCTCGLVVEGGADLAEAVGHLDSVTKCPATTYVLHLASRGSYQVLCRDCTWRQVRPSPALAEVSRRTHRCPAAEARRPVLRLRTRADMLAGALELIGWTVADDDPRAEAFLDRFIELGRAQKDGRISRDGAHETLRREFPLS